MKFIIDRQAFVKALSSVSRVVEKRSTIPILSNVAIMAGEKTLYLKATDLDLEVTVKVDADVVVTGDITVPAGLLTDVVKKQVGTTVTFEVKEDKAAAKISSGRSNVNLQCLPIGDFPDLSVGEFSNTFVMPAATLRTALDTVAFAISTEETRYYLNGVFMETRDEFGQLIFVATDGHRLARFRMKRPDGAGGMNGVIIPRKTTGEVLRLLDGTGDVQVMVSESKVRFIYGDTVLTSKLIDGTFPDYNRVIPMGNNTVALGDAAALRAASDRVSTISSERGRAVKFSFTRDNVNLLVNNPDSGSATDDVEISYDADPIEIGFNARYVADVLSHLKGDNVRISLADAGSPTKFTQEDDSEEAVTIVLMPMRV